MRQRVNTVFLFLVGKKKMKDFCSANLNLNTDSGVIVFLLTWTDDTRWQKPDTQVYKQNNTFANFQVTKYLYMIS